MSRTANRRNTQAAFSQALTLTESLVSQNVILMRGCVTNKPSSPSTSNASSFNLFSWKNWCLGTRKHAVWIISRYNSTYFDRCCFVTCCPVLIADIKQYRLGFGQRANCMAKVPISGIVYCKKNVCMGTRSTLRDMAITSTVGSSCRSDSLPLSRPREPACSTRTTFSPLLLEQRSG